MKVYNYLFYKSYLLAKKSGNFNDAPVLGGVMFVIACVMFNIFTLVGIISIITNNNFYFFENNKIIFAFTLLLSVLGYYLYKGRYKRIIANYENKKTRKYSFHPLIVILFYYSLSFGLLLLVGLYKHKEWIFAP